MYTVIMTVQHSLVIVIEINIPVYVIPAIQCSEWEVVGSSDWGCEETCNRGENEWSFFLLLNYLFSEFSTLLLLNTLVRLL